MSTRAKTKARRLGTQLRLPFELRDKRVNFAINRIANSIPSAVKGITWTALTAMPQVNGHWLNELTSPRTRFEINPSRERAFDIRGMVEAHYSYDAQGHAYVGAPQAEVSPRRNESDVLTAEHINRVAQELRETELRMVLPEQTAAERAIIDRIGEALRRRMNEVLQRQLEEGFYGSFHRQDRQR